MHDSLHEAGASGLQRIKVGMGCRFMQVDASGCKLGPNKWFVMLCNGMVREEEEEEGDDE